MIDPSQDTFSELGNQSMSDFRNSSVVDASSSSMQRGSITSLSSFKTNGLPTGARLSLRNSVKEFKIRKSMTWEQKSVKEVK